MRDFLLMVFPGAMYFWVLFVAQGPMQEVLQEMQSRVLPRLLACPLTPAQYLLSKMLRCFLLSGLALTLLVAVSGLCFAMRWGNPCQLAPVLAAWAGSMTGLLALIYGFCRTREQANVLAPLVLIVCAMLGGGMLPFENLPAFLQIVGQYTPNRWAALTLLGVANSKPWLQWLWPLAGLLSLALLGCGVSFFLFKRRLASGGRA